jgi:hypothetical protein
VGTATEIAARQRKIRITMATLANTKAVVRKTCPEVMEMTEINFEKQYTWTSEQKLEWFGDGPWVNEPDEVLFEYAGYKCKIVRVCTEEQLSQKQHMFGGYLCGYVCIPQQHPYFKNDISDMDVRCHGGITFKKPFMWIGFDCAHSGDYVPSIEKFRRENPSPFSLDMPEEFKDFLLFNPVYRDVDFCISVCKSMVDDLRSLQNLAEAKDEEK